MSDHSHERIYTSPPDAVFAAVIAALPRLRGRVRSVEQFGTTVMFSPTRDDHPLAGQLAARVLTHQHGSRVEITHVTPTEQTCEDFCPVRLLDEIGCSLAARPAATPLGG